MRLRGTAAALFLIAIGAWGVSFGQAQVQLGGTALATATDPVRPASLLVRSAYVNAYLHSVAALPVRAKEPEPGATARDALLEGIGQAARWLDLAGAGDSEAQWRRGECDPETRRLGPGLCGLRWRRNTAYADLRGRLDTLSTNVKARFVGRALAEHLEVDVDSSPEIRFTWEFD